jgi:hypothetical protein
MTAAHDNPCSLKRGLQAHYTYKTGDQRLFGLLTTCACSFLLDIYITTNTTPILCQHLGAMPAYCATTWGESSVKRLIPSP